MTSESTAADNSARVADHALPHRVIRHVIAAERDLLIPDTRHEPVRQADHRQALRDTRAAVCVDDIERPDHHDDGEHHHRGHPPLEAHGRKHIAPSRMLPDNNGLMLEERPGGEGGSYSYDFP